MNKERVLPMRRKIPCIFLAGLLVCVAVGCTPLSFSTAQKQEASFTDLFDTSSTVTVYGVGEADFAGQIAALKEELTAYHQLCDIYHPYDGVTNLYDLNRAGGKALVLDDRLLDVLEYGQKAYDETLGRVNICMGAVLSLWHTCRENAGEHPETAALPDQAALDEAMAHTDIRALVIDREAHTARLTDKSVTVDVGAIAKGYAVERAARFAREELGWTSAVLNIGGNIRVIGQKGDGGFRIGVQNPDTASAKAYIAKVTVSDRSVVTSGDYQRFFTVDGVRYAHIIDPATGYPAAYCKAVTVICADSGRADMLSTALFATPLEDALAWADSLDGVEAIFVAQDGREWRTAGFADYE